MKSHLQQTLRSATSASIQNLHSATNASIQRLKSLLGGPADSSRSPFALTPRDDLRVCRQDMQHHIKYFATAARGRSLLLEQIGVTQQDQPQPVSAVYTPSPMEVVRMGAEPIEYLDQFGPDSHWLTQIQQFKQELLTEGA